MLVIVLAQDQHRMIVPVASFSLDSMEELKNSGFHPVAGRDGRVKAGPQQAGDKKASQLWFLDTQDTVR